MDSIDKLRNVVETARKKSPFYRALYKDVPAHSWQLKDLPVISQDSFWKANVWGPQNKVLTDIPDQGMVFKSGGTSGQAKFSVYSPKEWERFTKDFGKGMRSSGLQPGDRVANLFYSGDLYASFLFINDSLRHSGVPLLNFPLSGNLDPDKIIDHLQQWDINVLTGVPASLNLLFERIRERKLSLNLERVFYGGEPMFASQKESIRTLVGDIQISSVGHASVDGGQLGYRDLDCDDGDHKSFLDSTILEILDPEHSEPVETAGVTGKLYVTNLTRTLMPVIRYPVGDQACWKDHNKRIYTLKGRSDEALRVGGMTLRWDEFESLALRSGFSQLENIQAEIRHIEGKDELTLAFGSDAESGDDFKSRVLDSLVQMKPEYLCDLEASLIRPVVIKETMLKNLVRNPRTGKLARISDLRPFH